MFFEREVIDSHMHLHNVENNEKNDFYTFFDNIQSEHGLKGLNLCACPITDNWGVENNILCALYKLHNPTAYAYGSFFYPEKPMKLPMPDGMDFLTQYNELMALGFDGIKMLETKALEQQEFQVFVDDECFDEYFTKCEKDGTHIIWHVADPETFWDINRIPARHLARGWYYGDGNYMKWEDIYKMVQRVLERHPKLKINFAHFFFLSEHPEWLVELFEKYENVGIDITPGAEMFGAFRERRDYYRDFFIKYSDRINYGTDVTFVGSANSLLRPDAVYKFVTTDEDVTVVVEQCKGLKLPDEACDNILCRNFKRLAGNTPRPIDKALLKKYINKYKSYINDPKALAHILEKEKEL